MPTYHYRCKSCHHEFEELQNHSASALVQCPSCKQHSLVRMIGGGAGLVFKGSGFYGTDYKKSTKKDGSGSKNGSPPESKKESPSADTAKKPSSGSTPSPPSE